MCCISHPTIDNCSIGIPILEDGRLVTEVEVEIGSIERTGLGSCMHVNSLVVLCGLHFSVQLGQVGRGRVALGPNPTFPGLGSGMVDWAGGWMSHVPEVRVRVRGEGLERGKVGNVGI